ncbi:MAG TPA: hypothetical protein PK867_20110, partial [Pirellulales bacterium]|nr:hypothetical protein [Pirellulales bacterium]
MIGRIIALMVWLAGTFSFCTTLVAAPGKDSLVLPKTGCVRLETSPGGQSGWRWADKVSIGWPAKVFDVNGQWLQISDEGGYTVRGSARATPWVRKDDVLDVNDDDTLSAYSVTIEGGRSGNKQALARLYWLRGICREADTPKRKAEPQIALADYEDATRSDPAFADAWLRQGRLLVRLDAVGARARWERCFQLAHERFIGVGVPTLKGQLARAAGPKVGSRARMVSWPPAVPNGWAEPIAPRELEPLPEGWSQLVPPQVYFDMGCAYKALCEARWEADNAKSEAEAARAEAARARSEADAALAESATAGSRVTIAQSEAIAAIARVGLALAEADKARVAAAKGPMDPHATADANLAIARAETNAADAKVLADLAQAAAVRAANSVAFARALAARAQAVAASAEALADRAEAVATMAEEGLQQWFDRACEYFRASGCLNQSWFRPAAAEGDLFLARVRKDLTE